jgi:ribA/ribD-fused uncharacterized protein
VEGEEPQNGMVIKMPKEIYFYTRKCEYGWMSNFDHCFQLVGIRMYRTNEHYYQSMKATDEKIAKWIAEAPTAYLAMVAGRNLREGEFKPNWDEIKTDVMLTGLRAKFKDPALRAALLNTGDAIIHEDSPTDMFWGVKGQDMLGKLLMQVREEIRNECKKEV